MTTIKNKIIEGAKDEWRKTIGRQKKPPLFTWEDVLVQRRKNTILLKKYLSNTGYPNSSEDREFQFACWYIAQHSDHDIPFQKQVLKLMEDLQSKNLRDYAHLYDRVAVHDGHPQRFGTQFKQDEKTGKISPHPLEEPDNIIQIRQKAGLKDWNLFLKQINHDLTPEEWTEWVESDKAHKIGEVFTETF